MGADPKSTDFERKPMLALFLWQIYKGWGECCVKFLKNDTYMSYICNHSETD